MNEKAPAAPLEDLTVLVLDENGCVWYGGQRRVPRGSSLRYQDWIRSGHASGLRSLGMAGHARHMGVLLDLEHRRRQGQIDRVLVCSPRLGTRLPCDPDPRSHVTALAGRGSVPSLGGWREVDTWDVATGRLIVGRDRAQSAAWRAMVQDHPLYPHLSFVTDLDLDAAGHVLAEIQDPRWWVNWVDPDDRIPLHRHMGVHGIPSPAGEARRRLLETACAAGDNCDGRHGSFVRRAGRLAARVFLDYVLDGWLDGTSLRQRGHLFVPELTLSSAAAGGYRAHVQAARRAGRQVG